MPAMKSLLPAVVAVTALVAGCGADPVASGPWRATVQLPGGELPFELELEPGSDGWRATVVNGAERIDVPKVIVDDERLELLFPAFNTRIEARRDRAGYAGELTLVKRGGKEQVMPFAARPGAAPRFERDHGPAAGSVDGRWAVTFVDDEGNESEAVAEFTQHGDRVTGTFLTPLGDYRFLAGSLSGDRLALSTFDGAHAFLFHAQLGDDGQLRGDFWSGTQWHESWTARRDEFASLPDADRMTEFVGDEVAFAFPDTSGEIVRFDDPRFAGKVVVIALAGTWCPNCHDEAAFLAPFHKKYRDRGFEIVGLMFEHLDDFDAAATQVDAFRDKFDIEYTLLVAGSSDKGRASETMSMLNQVYAFPTTIFVDRSGQVRRVHTGFQGPGTGPHYDRLVAGFTETVESLLTE